MPTIKKFDEHIIYENRDSQFPDRHARFAHVVKLPSGELIAMFEVAERKDAPSSKIQITRSNDNGRSWTDPADLYDVKALNLGFAVSETLKPTLLSDGSLIAIGYRFHRRDPNVPIGNTQTGGLLPGDVVTTFSRDQGRTWSLPKPIETPYPEVLEVSGPCIQTQSGDILAIGCPFKMWDGANPTGQLGILLRSSDGGKTWNSATRYFSTPDDFDYTITPWEARLCEMQPGRLVAIVWAYDMAANKHLPNHIVISHDNGQSWSAPASISHMAQATNLMYLHDDLLLSIHAHRAEDVGLYIRLVDFKNDQWRVITENKIWGHNSAQNIDKDIISQFNTLAFGQPSILRLDQNEFLATHWAADNKTQGRILTHRFLMEN